MGQNREKYDVKKMFFKPQKPQKWGSFMVLLHKFPKKCPKHKIWDFGYICMRTHCALLDFYNENQFLDPDLEDNAVYDDDGEAIEPEIEPKETEISVSGIDEIMNAIELAKDAIARHDPNAARKSKSEDVLTSLSKNYKLLRDKKTSIKKQITLDSFFKKP